MTEDEVFGCAVKFCRKEGTEVLYRNGVAMAQVCPGCKAQIEAEDFIGWAVTATAGALTLTRTSTHPEGPSEEPQP